MTRINPKLIPNCFPKLGKGKKPEGQAPSGSAAASRSTRPSQAEKGKAIVEDSVASPGVPKRIFERGETSGTAHDKPLPGEESGPRRMERERHTHNSDSESTESFLTSDSSRSSSARSEGPSEAGTAPGTAGTSGTRSPSLESGSADSPSLRHYIASPESDTGWGPMTLGDYTGPLTGGGSSGSSGSGSDILSGEGFNLARIHQKNGRLANLESQAMTPKRDPKFERTVENSPGYQRDFNPDNYRPDERPLNYLHETQSPFASLPPELKEKWTDNPRYLPKPELARRYEKAKRDQTALAAENTRLRGEVQALQGQIGEMFVDAEKDAKTNKLSGLALGGIGGIVVGTVAGMVMGSGPATPPNPQTPPAN